MVVKNEKKYFLLPPNKSLLIMKDLPYLNKNIARVSQVGCD